RPVHNRLKGFTGRGSLNSEELFEHNSLTCSDRTGNRRRERRIKTETSVSHCSDGVDGTETCEMPEASIDEFAICERQFALSGAGEELKPATLTVGSNLVNQVEDIGHSNIVTRRVDLVGEYQERQ